MRVQEMIMYVDNDLDSRGLAQPSRRKNAIRRVAEFINSTDIYLKNGHLNLPLDKKIFKDAYCRHKQSALSKAEDSAINLMYDILKDKTSDRTVQIAINNKVELPAIKDKAAISSVNHTQSKNLKTGLAPLIGESPKVLILGSLPGNESIKRQAYYSNTRNAFWRIMRTLFDNNTETDNEKFIISCGIALWDCVHSAIREGSLDSAIDDDSVVANDIKGLITKYPTINTIIFNGGKAEKYFHKYCTDINCETIRLISTSSAAAMTFEDKLKNWSIIKDLVK